MTQILAVGMVSVVISTSAERILLARGDSRSHMFLQAAQAILLLLGMAVGHILMGGARGVIIGASLGRLAGYFPLALAIGLKGLWLPRVDAVAFGFSLLVIGIGYAIAGAP